MGGNSSSKLSHYHLLHYTIPDENRLYLFDTKTENLFCIPVFLEGKPFFFGKLQTIICPQRQCLVIIGGFEVKRKVNFKYQKVLYPVSEIFDQENSKENQEDEEFDFDIENPEVVEVSILEKHMNSGVSLFAKISDYDEEKMLKPCGFVGVIDIRYPNSIRLNVDIVDIPQLKQTRTHHSLVYNYPSIFVIAGYQDNEPTKSCLKYNLLDHSFSDIASIGVKTNIKNPSCVVIEDIIYVFDSYNDPPFIHKYNITFDVWEDIKFRTAEFEIPRSLHSTVFRLNQQNLLYLNGDTGDNNTLINYYIFDLVKDKFIQERSDKKLLDFVIDNQGNRNYSKMKKIYYQLNDKKVKVFYKDLWYWDTLDLSIFKTKHEKYNKNIKGAGCCSKRK